MKNRNTSSHALYAQPVPSAPARVAAKTDSKWFYGSGLDLIIGCGAWSMPLLLLAYYCSLNYSQEVSIAFYALALIFNYPHYMATIYRAYRTKEDFQKYKIFTLHITLLVVLLIILSHVSYQALAFVFTLYLTWSPFHYTGQNFGIALLFARRNGVNTTPETRRTFYITFLASYAMFFLAVHSLTSTDQFILTLGIPPKAARILWVAMLAIFIVSSISSLYAFVKQTSVRAMTAPIVMLSTQIIWFVVPTALTLFSKIDFLQSPAIAGILAVMHSAQYLWITSYYARRESLGTGQDENSFAQSGGWRFYAYFFVLMIGGIALFVPGPWLASKVLHIDFTMSFLAFTALVNIHHFILDGAIWKLRDGRIASLLLNTKISENAESVDSRFSRFAKLWTGTGKNARMFKLAVCFGLLLIASVDQLKFYYGAKTNDANSLRTAQQINPYDAALQLKLALANERDGNQSAKRAALEEAININPDYRQAQVSLAKFLIESGKYQEAYAHYKQMFARLNPDVNSLVNFGILASQFNHEEEAINAWQRALDMDANQANAHLYLADALAKKKQFKDAIPHYEKYLVLVADDKNISDGHTARPNPNVILNVVLTLAVAYESVGDDEAASHLFTKSIALAEKIEDKQGLSFALIHLADIKAKHNKPAEALSDFQRALSLDHSGNLKDKAADWYKYGKFLQGVKAPNRLIFACFTKAYVLIQGGKDSDGDLHETIKRELNDIEPQLDAATIKTIKDDLVPVLQEALALKL